MRLFDDVASLIDDPMLRRAFELAEKGRGTTSPNPLVGCVIAQDDEIVGEGYHVRAGEPHAEAIALAAAGPRAAGATAYVTLEPCNHFGRTPPCSETLITRGVAGVVIGMSDPDPVAVGGAVRLREAGLEVEFGLDPTPYMIQNEAWLHYLRTGRPFVQVKTAVSLDGHASLDPGRRAAISGDGGRSLTMRLRRGADAVVVGGSTARIDDPALTVRDGSGAPESRQPLRVVLSHAPIGDASLFADGAGPAVALMPEGARAPRGIPVTSFDGSGGLRAAFAALGALGARHVLVEAGPALLQSLVQERAGDEYVFVHAGGFAGEGAPPLYPGSGDAGEDRLRSVLKPTQTGIIGDDAVTVWRPRDAATAEGD